ncbi:pyocin activator protein PrtN [Vibrio splendidus]|uniref:Pyocin activator protein PrtN n=2 Tax=Vibrio splendidus TaxID=29497 RepID=A0A2T5DWA6_VIBSP|nr:pyocin activator PrtN family protein [Vibrio splendidus]PTP11379.1 pyocin activator protein PrtN [Vibrio splendidus]
MNTKFALLARFENPTVELKQVSQEFFGITSRTAEQRRFRTLNPVPTFKLRDSERSPTLIKIDDLAAYIDQRYEQAKTEWQSVNL